jgi:hypothetical protein
MKEIHINLKNFIIIILNIILIFIIIYSYFNEYREGFSVGDINNMFNDIKDVTKNINKIPKEINNIDDKLTKKINNIGNQIEKKTEEMGNQIEKKTEEMGKKIEEKTINILTVKLKSIFIQIKDILNKGLIEPIMTLFNGIGNIFVQIFKILKEIIDKIVSLPNCILTYALKEFINTLDYIYNKIIPKFLRDIVSFIYKYTFRYIFEFIGYITGYTNSVEKCYGFNVSSQVDNINSSLNNIESSFKDNFGRLDFSKIKV